MTPHLLITDDDPDDILIFESEFASRNPKIPVTHFTGGLQLMHYLDACPDQAIPCVVLLDYKMSDFSGTQVLEMLDANDRYDGIVRIVWSTSQKPKEVQSCLRPGAADYLAKPASNEELDHLVNKLGTIIQSVCLDDPGSSKKSEGSVH